MPNITSTYKNETFEAIYQIYDDGNGRVVKVASGNDSFPSFEFYISPDGKVSCPDYSLEYSDKQYDDILMIGNDIMRQEGIEAEKLCR